MAESLYKGAEEARSQLPDLLTAAQRGQRTIITRHGRPVAALVPMKALAGEDGQRSLLPLAGSGRGLWGVDMEGADREGADSTETLRGLRGEWAR